jgi:hypothetical protein
MREPSARCSPRDAADLPAAWTKRRFRVPPDVVLHHADVEAEDRAWFSSVPVTNPRRTLNDCARAGLSNAFSRV